MIKNNLLEKYKPLQDGIKCDNIRMFAVLYSYRTGETEGVCQIESIYSYGDL